MKPLITTWLAIAGQEPTVPAATVLDQTDNPLWPYWVAISALATVVVTLFGLLMKSQRDRTADQKAHAEDLRALSKEFTAATEEKSRRVSEEFREKDKAILETSMKFASLMEKVANEIALLNDRERTR